MQRNAMLGMSLGQMLSGAFDESSKQKGVLDSTKINQLNADIGYKNAQTQEKQQEIDSRTDDSLAKSLIAGAGLQNGINGDNVLNDFNASLAGNYHPREQQGPSMQPGSYVAPPEYVSKFPELQQKFAGLKQMLALGDKNLPNLSKSIQGDQRNAITANAGSMTPQQVADASGKVALFESNPNQVEAQKAVLIRNIANGLGVENNGNALTLASGNGLYDNSTYGTFNKNTGVETGGVIANSAIAENKAKANQANSGANENNAQAGLANTRTQHIKDGKGDGSNATMKDMSQLRDDIRGEFNVQFPINSMTGTRKGAPNFRDFEKNWLKQFNVNESDYYRQSGSKEPATTKQVTKTPQRTSPVKSPNEIKSDFKAGKITRAQAEQALKAQGFQ